MKIEMEYGVQITAPLFPAFYVAKGTRIFTVLFFSEATGVVVKREEDVLWNIGELRGDWKRCTDSFHWERLPAGTKIVLTQE